MKLFGWWSKQSTKAELAQEDVPSEENPFPDPVELEITDVFDLHSIPPRQTKAVIEEYLLQAHARSFRYVRIIHGKGIGVQREITRKVLANTPLVLHFSDAPPEAGGWGATVVELQITEVANCEIADEPS
jgi:dsDNA-specific endonuclease/ATPase MutS2